MAQLIFAQAKSIRKKVKNAIKFNDDCGSDMCIADISSNVINREIHEFEEILKIAQLLHEKYESVVGKKTSNWYFITVRPKPGITFDQLYALAYKYTNRACMIDYTLSFEQKSKEGTGEGHHVHIVCETKHRSKTECLRDTISTFNSIADANCIDVKTTRNPQELIKNYLVEYKSDDEHKEPTKIGDAIWRGAMGLNPLYTPNNALHDPKGDMFIPFIKKEELLSSSPVTATNYILKLD